MSRALTSVALCFFAACSTQRTPSPPPAPPEPALEQPAGSPLRLPSLPPSARVEALSRFDLVGQCLEPAELSARLEAHARDPDALAELTFAYMRCVDDVDARFAPFVAELAHRASKVQHDLPLPHPELQLAIARAHYQRQAYAEARAAYRVLLDVDETHVVANLELSLLELRMHENLAVAQRLSERVASEGRLVYEYWLLLGDARLRLQRPALARESYRRATELDAGDPRGWFDLGLAAQASASAMGDLDEARQAFLRAADLSRDHPHYGPLTELALAHAGQLEPEPTCCFCPSIDPELLRLEEDAERQRALELERRALEWEAQQRE